MVWNKPPARLCSPGSTTDATYSVPAVKTKSAPMTAAMAPGKPKDQYGALGMMIANRRQATEDPIVPVTVFILQLGGSRERKRHTDRRGRGRAREI